MPAPRILPAGDAALLVACAQVIDPALNAWCVSFATAVQRRLGTAARDVVVGYCGVTVYFDPLLVDAEWLEGELATIAGEVGDGELSTGTLVEVPVAYGDEFGPDLEEVARFAGCAADEVVARHAATVYHVYMIGFVPGFAYMARVDPRIAAPRRREPRTAVPAGSVAIAGGQTGIYPDVTPGGWNIIGRTPLQPFDPRRAQPSLVKPGDAVRFHAIDAQDFRRLSPSTPAAGAR